MSIQQQGTALVFYAMYTATGAGKTGLTPTVDVFEGKTQAPIVSAGNASELADGLYYYELAGASVDANACYLAVFKTTDVTVDQQHIPALWAVPAWVANVDAAISSRLPTGTYTAPPTAGAVADAVLDEAGAGHTGLLPTYLDAAISTRATPVQIAAQVAAALTGTALTITRGDSLSVAFTGLGSLASCTKLHFTVKTSYRDADTAAIIQIEETAGLLYLNGAAATSAAAGDIAVTDAAAGDLTITLTAAATAALSVASNLVYDIQQTTAGAVTTLTAGTCAIAGDVTRAVT
jgi:hypothetical protein